MTRFQPTPSNVHHQTGHAVEQIFRLVCDILGKDDLNGWVGSSKDNIYIPYLLYQHNNCIYSKFLLVIILIKSPSISWCMYPVKLHWLSWELISWYKYISYLSSKDNIWLHSLFIRQSNRAWHQTRCCRWCLWVQFGLWYPHLLLFIPIFFSEHKAFIP
jgi:hypothetical protein